MAINVLISELKFAVENNLFFMAINLSLTIPDICAALESENGRTNGKKYGNWFNKYVASKYNNSITGDDIYKIRCAALHQGKYDHDNPEFCKVIFQILEQGIIEDNNRITPFYSDKPILQLNAKIFINNIIDGVNEWLLEMSENYFYIQNSQKGFQFYMNGFPFVSNNGKYIG